MTILINRSLQVNAFNVNFTKNFIDINMITIIFAMFNSFSMKFSKFKTPITNGFINHRDAFWYHDKFNITTA